MCNCGRVVAICFINEYIAFYELNSSVSTSCSLRSTCLSQGLLQHGTSLERPIDAISNDTLTVVCSKRQTAHVSTVFE